MASSVQSRPLPELNIPTGTSTCSVSIINTTCSLVLPNFISVGPPIEGHKWMNVPVYAFHITHQASGTQLLFDLGCRKDWWNLVPQTVDLLEGSWPGIKVDKDVKEILEDGGVRFAEKGMDGVSKVILSHSHFDHVGDLSALPKEVEVVVGPGFKKAMMPGYPTNAESTFHEAELAGKTSLRCPLIRVLRSGGHAVGHICALVRTIDDSYLLLGGDTCHFVGAMRPSGHYPMPDPLPDATVLDKRIPSPCPCAIFEVCHRDRANARVTPFYDLVAPAFPDTETSMQSLRALAEFDADESVLVVIAHDTAPLDVMPFFPNGTINDWKRRGYKEKMHFHFVNELPIDGIVGREPLVDGVYRDGARIKTLEGEKL